MNTALTIAGTDPSGGAGMQADLKTFTAMKVYGMCAITAVLAQNTCGVRLIENVSIPMVEAQLDCVFEDIFPDAVKIGMVSSIPIIEAIAGKLRQYGAKNVVLDTVMVSTSGHRLIDEDAQSALTQKLMPLSDIITPNLPEAEALCGFAITDKASQQRAAEKIAEGYGGYILIKGGHFDGGDDMLYKDGRVRWYPTRRVETHNTHGTGCTLSSAITAGLAKGLPMEEAVERAKEYITGALASGLDLGKGNGPVDHCFAL
ncbi:bifunctional hydroxymethylpyrimidine kinase/phosphomethylpyrimidine kinase [Zongyangia hominis]|uniref:Hydroxymethylpyrimidine/phosphomethylpyrimidine kinase n=1 Tax=Zongyangia hominis TaxID=2763677 RepID=A0A926I795_9FIRM|nr:bifunctional hydroxymethylpyrimidine kinase/phosphomethylpyrimidine kinase [Zongyangia hominis]MBC8570854.1 bifunctional hydroxymethylpyrimidine kinase/phosphomethylpyrimidine kinase [Zongyangia hominis]